MTIITMSIAIIIMIMTIVTRIITMIIIIITSMTYQRRRRRHRRRLSAFECSNTTQRDKMGTIGKGDNKLGNRVISSPNAL